MSPCHRFVLVLDFALRLLALLFFSPTATQDYKTFDFSDDDQYFDSYYGFLYKYFYGVFYSGRSTYNYRSFVAFRALGNFVRGGFNYNLHQSFYQFFYSVAFNQGFNYPLSTAWLRSSTTRTVPDTSTER